MEPELAGSRRDVEVTLEDILDDLRHVPGALAVVAKTRLLSVVVVEDPALAAKPARIRVRHFPPPLAESARVRLAYRYEY